MNDPDEPVPERKSRKKRNKKDRRRRREFVFDDDFEGDFEETKPDVPPPPPPDIDLEETEETIPPGPSVEPVEPEEEAPPPTGPVDEAPVEEPVAEEAPSGEEILAERSRRRAASARVRKEKVGGGLPIAVPAIVLAAVATIVVTAIKTRLGSIDYSDFVFFLVVFTAASYFELELRGGGSISLGLAPLLAALVAIPGIQVVWMFLIGTIVVLITKIIGKVTKEDLLGSLIELTGVGVAALVYWGLVKLLPEKPLLLGRYTPSMLIAIGVAAILLFGFYVVKETFVLTQEGHFPAVVYSQSVARKVWMPFLIIGFTGVLMGLIFHGIGMWSVLFALPLLLVFLVAYNKVAQTDQYLLETIRVLSVIPEETGMVPPGHAEKVARIAVGVARELGLSPEDVQQVEYAAYLQDIGMLTGAPQAETDQQRLLELNETEEEGVDIIGRVKYLEVAAEILRGREGLRDRVMDVDKRRVVSVGAGILKAVDDFESLVEGSGEKDPMTEQEALTEMNLERGVRYDSKVLRAIARVLNVLRKEGFATSAERSPESSPFWGDQEA